MKNQHTSVSWGVALSGGGARGIIHLGVLSAMDDAGIKPVCIAGTSIGAVVGAFYAGGVKPEKMLKLLSGKSFYNMFSIKPSISGFLELKYLKNILHKMLPERFEDLEIPLFVCTTNLSRHEEVVFHAGPLEKPVLASATIPVLFNPIVIAGDLYVDGGVLNNLPAEYCKGHCERVLGVDVNYGNFNPDLRNLKNIAMEVFHITVQRNTAHGMAQCDGLIRPFLTDEYQMLDFSKAESLFELGYAEGEKWLKSQAELLPDSTDSSLSI